MIWALAVTGLFTASGARGASPASDNAGNYGNGLTNYQNGANAGAGFQPFNLFQYDSSGNFLADYNPGGSAISSAGGKVFNIYAQYGGFAGITRSFTDNTGSGTGPLNIGQTMSFRLDLANTVNGDGGVGFTFESNNGQNVNFAVNGGSNSQNQFGGDYGALTGIKLSTLEGGLAFSLTVDTARQFTVTAQGVSDPTVVGSYTFTTQNDLNLTGLTVYDYNSGPNNDLFFNDLTITGVPEPATYLVGIGGLAVVFLKLCRRRGNRLVCA